ncbi:hypothetical protein AB6A40_011644 [Gnathostoma spinigerum]|uniref:Uncharacterized protein n=1 Tax=Gnathostoma spinigerum TaxID=75299 RepID=A0ABD6EY98_9BILA
MDTFLKLLRMDEGHRVDEYPIKPARRPIDYALFGPLQRYLETGKRASRFGPSVDKLIASLNGAERLR